MSTYTFPTITERPAAEPRTVYTIANGDLRLTTNVKTWAMQQQVEGEFAAAVESLGWKVKRAHDVNPATGHGFIDSQHYGRQVFKNVPKDAPLVVVEAVWQYSHHVLHGLRDHQGPILLVANFAGDFPGLVGMLNLHGSMVKAGIRHSTLWSKDFTDEWARTKLAEWLETGEIVHDISHVRDLPALPESEEKRLGEALAAQLKEDKAIIAVFDEYCMGMYNALIDDELMNPAGIYKERLSQSALVAEMNQTSDEEAAAVRSWLDDAGLTFHVDNDGDWKENLTDEQLNSQMKMYIAAVRMADDFGADVVGIQYQQGLKDMVPASDLVEGSLNNDRPPVTSRRAPRVLREACRPQPTRWTRASRSTRWRTGSGRRWASTRPPPCTTSAGATIEGDFVVETRSVPASHLVATHLRPIPAAYISFPVGGTLSGVSARRDRLVVSSSWTACCTSVWLHLHEMPDEEVQRLLNSTNKECGRS
ncbi:MAG: hypothetical protein KIT69_04940 [Propionibacteriaceae bacterium]|nr:hypothetical protein [Propionibacteriaceae bacterium]